MFVCVDIYATPRSNLRVSFLCVVLGLPLSSVVIHLFLLMRYVRFEDESLCGEGDDVIRCHFRATVVLLLCVRSRGRGASFCRTVFGLGLEAEVGTETD